MGGNSATTERATASGTGFPDKPGSFTMQPAPPGLIEALATQLQAGYGGDQRAFLDTLYRQMTFPSFHAPGTTAGSAVPSSAPAGSAAAPGINRLGAPSPMLDLPVEQLLSRSPSMDFGGIYKGSGSKR